MRLTLRGRRVIMALAMALSLGAGLTAQHWDPYTRQLDRGAVCFEDQPCWDCATMGNRICGVTR